MLANTLTVQALSASKIYLLDDFSREITLLCILKFKNLLKY